MKSLPAGSPAGVQRDRSVADLRAAIVGTGFMGRTHVEALHRLGVGVQGVLGSGAEKSQQAVRQYRAETVYRDFEQILADDRVDAVHIVTPNRHHFSMAGAAIRAGKHVMCEKPLAMTSRETAELARLAGQRSDLVTAVTYNVRFYPLCLEARHRVASGDLGDLFHATGSYSQDWLLHATDYNWRVLASEGGSLRAAADIGTHLLDLIQFITGRCIRSLCADLQTVHPVRRRPVGEVETFSGRSDSTDSVPVDITTDDCGAILFELEGGARGAVWLSQVAAGHKNCIRVELAGSKASLSWNSQNPDVMQIGHRDRPNESLIRDPSLLSESAAGFSGYPGGHNEGYADTFKQCFAAFYGAIACGSKPAQPLYATFDDGHHELLLCDAIARSAAGRSWVDVEAVSS